MAAERYGPGQMAGELRPGDFILTHAEHLTSRLIRLGQRARFRGAERKYAHWSHSALLVDDRGTLVEAEQAGVERSPLSKYRDVEYHLVRLDPSVGDGERQEAARFATSKIGDRFGYKAMASIGLSVLSGGRLSLGHDSHQICSSLVALALMKTGKRFDRDPEDMLPADLAQAYGVTAG